VGLFEDQKDSIKLKTLVSAAVDRGLAPNLRAPMREAHRQLDRGMTEELLDALDGRATHDTFALFSR
jgi:hypothetical protein